MSFEEPFKIWLLISQLAFPVRLRKLTFQLKNTLNHLFDKNALWLIPVS